MGLMVLLPQSTLDTVKCEIFCVVHVNLNLWYANSRAFEQAIEQQAISDSGKAVYTALYFAIQL